MPGATLDAVADHGEITGDTVPAATTTPRAGARPASRALGISYAEVVDLLEREGVDKFEKSWAELLGTVSDELARVSAADSDEEAHR